MSTRISDAAARIVLLALALAGCGGPQNAERAKAEAERKALANAEARIVCAPPGAKEFARVCGLDRRQTQDGLYLTIRHPDGGFRRLIVTRDGSGVAAADGAEVAKVTPVGPHEIEVSLGGARYRLPATVKEHPKS